MIRVCHSSMVNNFFLLDYSKYEFISDPQIYIIGDEVKINFDILINYDYTLPTSTLKAAGLSDRIIGFPCVEKPEQSLIMRRYGIKTPKIFSILTNKKYFNNTVFIQWISRFRKENKDSRRFNNKLVFKPNNGSLGCKQFILNDNDLFNMNSMYLHKIIPDVSVVKMEGHDRERSICEGKSDLIVTENIDKCENGNMNQLYDELASKLNIDNPTYWHLSEYIDDYKDTSIERYEYRVIVFYSDKNEYSEDNLIIMRREKSKWQFVSTHKEGFSDKEHEKLFKNEIYGGIMNILRDYKSPFISIDLFFMQNKTTKDVVDYGVFEMQMEFGMRYHNMNNGLVDKLNRSMDLIVESLNI